MKYVFAGVVFVGAVSFAKYSTSFRITFDQMILVGILICVVLFVAVFVQDKRNHQSQYDPEDSGEGF